MPVNLGINTSNMKVSVIKDKKIVKQEDLTKEELRELMSDLCNDEMLLALRKASRLFGTKKFLFKNVEV